MPYGDGTGPMGNGPQTGRGRGRCHGGGGRRMGAGGGFWRGRGFGRRMMAAAPAADEAAFAPWWAADSPETEAAFLEEKARHLQAMLEAVNRRLESLKQADE